MKSWINNKVLGRILIIVGMLAVINTLFPICLYENSRGWPAAEGIITSSKVLGFVMRFRRAITYTYQVGTKEFTGTQMIPRDPWVDELKEGSKISLRYKNDDPKFTVIDHQQVCQSLLLSLWNAIWIIAGIILLRRK